MQTDSERPAPPTHRRPRPSVGSLSTNDADAKSSESDANRTKVGLQILERQRLRNDNSLAGGAPRPFATLQRGNNQRAPIGSSGFIGTLGKSSGSKTTAVGNEGIVPSASTTVMPSSKADGEPGLSRAQSLRDIASKFEKLNTKNSNTSPPVTSATALPRVPEKRFSLLESGSASSTNIATERHHSTPPPTFDDVTVSKEYLVELFNKLDGSFSPWPVCVLTNDI